MDSTTAVSYANSGAGRAPQLAMLARGMRESEASLRYSVAALRIAGEESYVADALPRFSVRAQGQGPRQVRELRVQRRNELRNRCGPMNVDMMANDAGTSDWGSRHQYPAHSAFEGPLIDGQLWWFPRTDLVGFALTRISWPLKESWPSTHVCL